MVGSMGTDWCEEDEGTNVGTYRTSGRTQVESVLTPVYPLRPRLPLALDLNVIGII